MPPKKIGDRAKHILGQNVGNKTPADLPDHVKVANMQLSGTAPHISITNGDKEADEIMALIEPMKPRSEGPIVFNIRKQKLAERLEFKKQNVPVPPNCSAYQRWKINLLHKINCWHIDKYGTNVNPKWFRWLP